MAPQLHPAQEKAMKLPTICFVNRSRPGRLGVFIDSFKEHPGEDMFVCFHTLALAKEFFDFPPLAQRLKTSGHPAPWQIERLRVAEWAKIAEDFFLLHKVQRVAFM